MVGRNDSPAPASWVVCGYAALCLAIIAASGCGGGPRGVDTPSWDPPALADAAISQLDKNGDKSIDATELAAAPGLAAGVRHIDLNKDDRLDRDELTARFQRLSDSKIGFRSQSFKMTYKGRPLANVEARFVPEPFLAGVIEPAVGTSDVQGVVSPVTEGQDIPAMRIGYYRVQVKSPEVRTPAKYNGESTPLGADVTLSDDTSSYGTIELRLTD